MSLEINAMSNSEKLSGQTLDQLFRRLQAEDIEQFYMAYQLWSQRQQIEQLQLQMLDLQRKIDENATSMEQFQPSVIALASLAQLQACGVEDTDLLDRMLERGEEWLDHSIQLLERCEQLDLIGGDYTQWCEHALEGAYDWIDSMTDPNLQEVSKANTENSERQEIPVESNTEVTEEQLLSKLMSEEGERDIHTTEVSQDERVDAESETGAILVDTEERSNQEPQLANIEENESNVPNSTQQQSLQDPPSLKKTASQKKKGFLSGLLSKFRKQ